MYIVLYYSHWNISFCIKFAKSLKLKLEEDLVNDNKCVEWMIVVHSGGKQSFDVVTTDNNP